MRPTYETLPGWEKYSSHASLSSRTLHQAN
jgi:hypothetical protein